MELIIQLIEWVHTAYALNPDPGTIPYFIHTYAYTYIHMYMGKRSPQTTRAI